MPSTNCTLTDSPSGSETGTRRVEFHPPPFGCVGGSSRIVPVTVTVHGADWAAAAQVAVSVMFEIITSPEVRARRSATPAGAGKVVRLMRRKRSADTFCPVWLTTRRRMVGVPKVELFDASMAKSRTRFGGEAAAFVASRRRDEIVELRWMGEERFSGPGAPSRWPAP